MSPSRKSRPETPCKRRWVRGNECKQPRHEDLRGIDGGGTRTRVALAREDGVLAGYAEGQSASFADHG